VRAQWKAGLICHWHEPLWEEVRESVVVVQLKDGTAPQLMSSSRCTSTRTSRIRVSGRVRRTLLKRHLDIFRRKRPDTTPWPTLLTLEAPRKARPWIRTWYRECSHWLVSRNPRGPRRHRRRPALAALLISVLGVPPIVAVCSYAAISCIAKIGAGASHCYHGNSSREPPRISSRPSATVS